jgi:hypothetical protein
VVNLMTLDGVIQSALSAEEDREGGFTSLTLLGTETSGTGVVVLRYGRAR